MRDYVVAFGLDEEQQEGLFYYLRVMDQAFLKFHKPKETPKRGKGSKWRPASANSPSA